MCFAEKLSDDDGSTELGEEAWGGRKGRSWSFINTAVVDRIIMGEILASGYLFFAEKSNTPWVTHPPVPLASMMGVQRRNDERWCARGVCVFWVREGCASYGCLGKAKGEMGREGCALLL